MIKKTIIIFAVLFILWSFNLGYCEDADYPKYIGYVNDYAGILSEHTESLISSFAEQLEAASTAQFTVVTVATVEPSTIESYAVELFENWGIGRRDEDNGVLLLIAVNDKHMRIETGYGLEGVLPDVVCHHIIDKLMIPKFRDGDLEEGILLGSAKIVDLIAREYDAAIEYDKASSSLLYKSEDYKKAPSLFGVLFSLLLFIMFFGMRSGLLFFWLLGPTGRRRNGYWYGSGYGGGGSGGFGGGFGGFGGGLSGGGGASGSW